MLEDLNTGVKTVIVPTVREADGLAMSSRNAYLSPQERAQAPVLSRALRAVEARVAAGERDGDVLRALMTSTIAAAPLATIDYVSVADAGTLEELPHLYRKIPSCLYGGPVRYHSTHRQYFAHCIGYQWHVHWQL